MFEGTFSLILISYNVSVLVYCCMRAPRGAPWVSGLVGHFIQTWPDSELLSHSAVLRLLLLELMLQSLSPVLALYDPFGVDVLLNCDTTWSTFHSPVWFCGNKVKKMNKGLFSS